MNNERRLVINFQLNSHRSPRNLGRRYKTARYTLIYFERTNMRFYNTAFRATSSRIRWNDGRRENPVVKHRRGKRRSRNYRPKSAYFEA